MKKGFIFIFILGMVVAFVWLLPGTVRAHGEPVIVVKPISVPAGGEILVSGTEMEDGEVFVVTLEGITTSIPLGEAAVVDEGFEMTLIIPADVPPGSYRVQASTGEETASADLTVTPAANGVEGASPAEDQPEPSAEPMTLDRPGSAIRSISVIVLALLSLGLGFWLLRR